MTLNIITHSGHLVDLDADVLDLGENMVKDVAMHLSRIPRFGGATTVPYTVADHCYFVAIVAERLALDINETLTYDGGTGFNPVREAYLGLMHEVDEAYGLGDVVGQLKRRFCPQTREMLKGFKKKLHKAFNLQDSRITDVADAVLLIHEFEVLVAGNLDRYDLDFKDEEVRTVALEVADGFTDIRKRLEELKPNQKKAYKNFLKIYNTITGVKL